MVYTIITIIGLALAYRWLRKPHLNWMPTTLELEG